MRVDNKSLIPSMMTSQDATDHSGRVLTPSPRSEDTSLSVLNPKCLSLPGRVRRGDVVERGGGLRPKERWLVWERPCAMTRGAGFNLLFMASRNQNRYPLPDQSFSKFCPLRSTIRSGRRHDHPSHRNNLPKHPSGEMDLVTHLTDRLLFAIPNSEPLFHFKSRLSEQKADCVSNLSICFSESVSNHITEWVAKTILRR